MIKQFGEIGKDIEITSDVSEEKETNEFDEWINNIEEGGHVLCVNPIFNMHGTRTVSGKVLRKVYGEDIMDEPIPNVINYWTVVKKWYEHNIPLNDGDDYVYTLKPVYTYFTPRGKNAKPVIYQAKEHKKDAMYFLPDDCNNPKECDVKQLVKINDDSNIEYILQETKFGPKVFAKVKYNEDFIVENHDKIFPYELADKCVQKYWSDGTLNIDYKVTDYVA